MMMINMNIKSRFQISGKGITMIKIDIIKKRENAVLPKKMTEGSAGWDLFACIENEITIKPKELIKIPTGIAIALPNKDMVGLIFARSGMATKNGISLANGVGVIDSDYRGEIIIGLSNISNKEYTIKPSDRIAQMVIMPVINANFNLCDKLENTARGKGGFGSTGS